MFACVRCDKTFTRKDNLQRHEREVNCAEEAHSSNSLKRYGDDLAGPSKRIKPNNTATTYCSFCNITLSATQMIGHLRTLQHRTNSAIPLNNGVQLIQSAFKCRIASYRVEGEGVYQNFNTFFDEIKHKVVNLIEDSIRSYTAVKVNVEVFARYILHSQDTVDIKSFNTPFIIINESIDIDSVYGTIVDKIINQSSEFEEKDSGKSYLLNFV